MSESDDRKKAHERKVLLDALRVARSKGAEARRNVDRISGSIEAYEKPDFLIHAVDGKLIGIEHFRVDHFVKGGRKAKSAAAEFSAVNESGRKKIVDSGALERATGEVEQFFGERLSRAIQLSKNACIADIVRSLEACLYSSSDHVGKLPVYRSRVDEMANGHDFELGFLIEVHTDLRGLFINDNSGTRKIACGELPMIAEIYDLLKGAAANLDWIILAFCGGITDAVEDAAVIRCDNGAFDESMRRQGFGRVEYLGLGKNVPKTRQRKQGKVTFSLDGSNIHYEIENASEDIDVVALWHKSIVDGARALTLAKEGNPFVSTLPIQMTYEMLRDGFTHKRGVVSASDVERCILTMSLEERNLRAEAFAHKWDISGQ